MRLQLTLLVAAVFACGDDAAPLVDAPASPDTAAPIDAAPIDAPTIDAGPDAPSLCDSEERDDDYTPGLTKTGPAGYAVVLTESDPVPGRTGNYAWTIQVRDAADQPVEGAVITARPFMPDHGHGTSPTPTVTPAGGGNYAISPINLFMSGYWTIRLTMRDGSGADLDVVTFAFCVAAS